MKTITTLQTLLDFCTTSITTTTTSIQQRHTYNIPCAVPKIIFSSMGWQHTHVNRRSLSSAATLLLLLLLLLPLPMELCFKAKHSLCSPDILKSHIFSCRAGLPVALPRVINCPVWMNFTLLTPQASPSKRWISSRVFKSQLTTAPSSQPDSESVCMMNYH